MSDPFAIEPPRWLQEIAHPLDPKATGEALSGMLGGFYNMANGMDSGDAFASARMSLQDPMWKFHMDTAKAKAQSQVLELAQQRNMLDYSNQVKSGQVEFANTLSEVAKAGGWNDPAARSKVFDVGARFPALMDTPVWKQTMDNFSKADVAKSNADKWQKMAEQAQQKIELSQQAGVDKDKLTEERIQLLKDKQDLGPKETQLVDQIMSLKQQAKAAQTAGDNAGYQTLTEKADLLTATLPGSGDQETFQGYNDQGNPTFQLTRGKGGAKTNFGGATVGMATQAQTKLAKYENATQLINGLQKSLRPMDVGAAGVAGEYLGDRLGPQVPGFENLFSQQRVDNRAVLGAVRESLMREISDDSRRFSNQDREDIAKILPSTGVLESYPDAMARLDKVKNIIIDRTRTYSEAVGEPLPAFAKTKDEIVSDYQKKSAAIQKAITNNPQAAAELQAELAKAKEDAKNNLIRFH